MSSMAQTEVQELVFGDTRVTRVIESAGNLYMTPSQFFPDSEPAMWEKPGVWNEPEFLIPAGESVHEHTHRVAFQTWVIRSAGKVILVDTGVGNDKERPYVPLWSHLNGDFLDRLAAAGVRPEDVDVVVNTHIHPDHTGWNTVLRDRVWTPTFPNATYYLTTEDLEFWNPANGHQTVLGPGAQNMWEDSVAPILDAGQVKQWSGTERIDENLLLEAAPGHTPGSSILRLTSGGEEVLFIGDILHTPLQVGEPAVNSCFCQDPQLAAETRRRVFTEAAAKGTLMFPAHFTGKGAFTVRADGDAFALAGWAPLVSA